MKQLKLQIKLYISLVIISIILFLIFAGGYMATSRFSGCNQETKDKYKHGFYATFGLFACLAFIPFLYQFVYGKSLKSLKKLHLFKA